MSTVLITGCSSGFGRLAALSFAREGHEVFASMRNLDKAGPLRDAAAMEGLKITVIQLDVVDDTSVDRAVKEVLAEAGAIDIVVNNAGMEVRGPIEQVSHAEALRQFETNVFGVLRVLRAVLPGMRDRQAGVIMNLSSIAGLVASPFGGLYSASKHALEAITESLHYEVAPYGIRVALIEPGRFATEFGANIVEAAAFTADSPYRKNADRLQAALLTLSPDAEAADAQEVADLIVRVATQQAAPLRHTVGKDAEMIMSVRNSTDFEGFEQTMRTALNWMD